MKEITKYVIPVMLSLVPLLSVLTCGIASAILLSHGVALLKALQIVASITAIAGTIFALIAAGYGPATPVTIMGVTLPLAVWLAVVLAATTVIAL